MKECRTNFLSKPGVVSYVTFFSNDVHPLGSSCMGAAQGD